MLRSGTLRRVPSTHTSRLLAAAAASVALSALTHARAQEPNAEGRAAVAGSAAPSAPAATMVHLPTTKPQARVLFTADPVTDGAILSIGAGFAVLSGYIVGTGEITPQQIRRNFDTDHLLAIDRPAVTQTIDKNANLMSNVALTIAVGFAAADPILSGVREKSFNTFLVDAMIYGEAIALTNGVTNLAKLAVRRPRPQAYIEFAKHRNDPGYSNTDTDSSLSFFSGHASVVGSIAGTATYLAFARSPSWWRGWVTLAGGLAFTTFVSIERVRSGAHFPTDVICGSIAGGGIGVLVAHLHRAEESKAKRIWVGWQGVGEGQGGGLNVNGAF
jgi:membrane-associated phospholipid phosphatase